MTFRDPWVLISLPVIAAFIFYIRRKERKAGLRFSSTELLNGLKVSLRSRMSRNLIFIRMASLVLIIFALARPQLALQESKIQTEGIDITMAIDCSTSMLAEDFQLNGKRENRLTVVKEVVKDFIEGRPNDRIAIVAFSARAYTVCPLTLDHGWLLENLGRIYAGMIEDGTAIGYGIASALNRLKDTKAKDKVVVLLTDGRNNTGKISPISAAEAAKTLKIKVYTIGAGTKGLAPYPVKDLFGNTVYQPIRIDIDEDALIKIANITNAKYFRATDTQSLKEIYKEIDRLEKTPMEEKGYLEYKELFPDFLISGMILLVLEIILGNTIFRKIP